MSPDSDDTVASIALVTIEEDGDEDGDVAD
jgi:hypothetical protein